MRCPAIHHVLQTGGLYFGEALVATHKRIDKPEFIDESDPSAFVCDGV
jgi:hypothetical protein